MPLLKTQLLLVLLSLASLMCAAHADDRAAPVAMDLKNASEKADFSRLPRFYTSDPAYDEFVNDYFMRHLSVDDRAIYTGSVVLGCLDVLWVIDWDQWMLPWIDRGAMGLARQGGNKQDIILTSLLNTAIDKYGYAWGSRMWLEPRDSFGGWVPTFGWPWPKYNRNYTVTKPTGWEFNDIADAQRDLWTTKDVTLEPGYANHSLAGTISGPHPELISPEFDCDAFQVPIVELDITYKTPSGKGADKLIDGLRIYWTTSDSPEFSEDKMVNAEFADLPPKDFPTDYFYCVHSGEARYSLYSPMCLNPKWGTGGRRITRLKIVPCGPRSEGVSVMLNYVRASYDVRSATNNSVLINTAYRFFTWSGDEDFLRGMMPRLRRSTIFLNEHLQGRKEALIDTEWFVGHDGLGGDKPGHGQIGAYWDLLPCGRWDIESSAYYYHSLLAMAELEEAASRRKIKIPDVSVLGPDNKTVIGYHETPTSLRKLAARVKQAIEQRFWLSDRGRFCRNIDTNGNRHDYGFLHFNVQTLAYGVGTPAQRDSILSWLDGRAIEGDTSTGSDIYKWRFAPRTSTKRNTGYYYWAWIWDWRAEPNSPYRVWGDQFQDGGAAPFTSYFELKARTSTGRQDQIDRAFERTKEIQAWFNDVKSAGGKGSQFYRAYYDNHPERGKQQSPMPGGLGLDHEFLSDSSLGTIFLLSAFLGVDATEDGVLSIAPAIPAKLDKIGVENVFYRGNHLRIEAGRDYVSLEGSTIPAGSGLRLHVTLRNAPPGAVLYVDGKLARSGRTTDSSVQVTTDLRPVRVELRL